MTAPTPTPNPAAELARWREVEQAATSGPWWWRNTNPSQVYLQGARTRIVMAFERMGMHGAQPSFRDASDILRPAGRENLNAIPDAAFIATARTAVPALLAAVEAVLALVDAAEGAPLRDLHRDVEGNPFPAEVTTDALRTAIATAIGGAR